MIRNKGRLSHNATVANTPKLCSISRKYLVDSPWRLQVVLAIEIPRYFAGSSGTCNESEQLKVDFLHFFNLLIRGNSVQKIKVFGLSGFHLKLS